jgi:hypothetical protein
MNQKAGEGGTDEQAEKCGHGDASAPMDDRVTRKNYIKPASIVAIIQMRKLSETRRNARGTPEAEIVPLRRGPRASMGLAKAGFSEI